MTDPQQQPSGSTDPTWQSPSTPATPPAYDPYQQSGYGQAAAPQSPGYSQSDYAQPAYPQPGYAQPAYGYAQPAYVARRTNAMAIASLVCSLAGLFTLISAPVGAVLGHVARRQIRQTGEDGDGMALAGIIVGWSLTGLILCGCVAYIAVVALAVGSAGVNT